MSPVVDPARPRRRAAVRSPFYPLDEFYALAGMPLPRIDLIPGAEVPEPYRTLLVHNHDMTPTLEDYFGSAAHLEILRRRRVGTYYFREVVLHLDDGELPIEFGANRISLDLLPPAVREGILEERLPLGRILKLHAVPHTSRPEAFLRVEPDKLIHGSLLLMEPRTLYGRRNTLRDPLGRPLSEIVEILPPVTR